MILSILSLLLIGTAHAQSFTPIQLPGGNAFPQVPDELLRVTSPDVGTSYEETDPSPEMVVARASLRLAEAQEQERSAEGERLHRQWTSLEAEHGALDPRTQVARAHYLRQAEGDLTRAKSTYSAVVRTLEGVDRDAEPSDTLKQFEKRVAEAQASVTRYQSLGTAACALDPQACVRPDPAARALLAEIMEMIPMAGGHGLGGGAAATVLLERARLLEMRAELGLILVRLAATDAAMAAVTPLGEDGMPKRLPSPFGNDQPGNSYDPYDADPYTDGP